MLSHLTALESAYMGRNLLPTTYGNSLSAFHKAHMSTLTLGKLVSNLNANEFKGCSNLAIINSLNPTPPACADATTFDSVDKTACALHVPLGCKGAYQAAPVWEAFFSRHQWRRHGRRERCQHDHQHHAGQAVVVSF